MPTPMPTPMPSQSTAGAVAVTGITHDSRSVRPGDLYAALPGARVHGADFVAAAAAAGAVAVLTDAEGAARGTGELPALVVDAPRSRVGELAAWIYDEPARDLTMLGITGTNGKTTTAYLLEACLRAAGRATGLVGTIETRIGDERVPSVRTTPEAPDLQALLAVMRERGVDAVVMEVSSHALALGRVDGVVFDVAVFTNLSQDHLDFHSDLDDYFRTKASLFTPARARLGVVNVDDAYGARLATSAPIPVVTVSPAGGADADWCVSAGEVAASGSTTGFTLQHRDGRSVRAASPLAGSFNVANTALALVTCLAVGAEPARAVRGLAGARVPGRMEQVQSTGVDEPLAVVDYAHTPEAVESVLAALRAGLTGRLVVVLGAGGDRDAGKRPQMGAA
ncbi:MAG: UDP-N-acetylmuramoyl-L-alanyl-D-glutamate--2,6-diaminopimelate ligase, partial [Actinomycetota bacterium]|nr:UDP-N-acetylmuramoyl-L-alanyl-D-glutamate--2,6-diaminopimelate ligase [Actinomycetota bacterium]